MAATTVTLEGGLLFSGKALTVPSGASTSSINIASLSGGSITNSKTNSIEAAGSAFANTKISVIDVKKNGVNIVGGGKALTVSLAGGNNTVTGSTAADKIYGNSGADTFVLTGTKTGGNDQIFGYGNGNDRISLASGATSLLSFADNVQKGSVVITTGDGAKYTVTKKNASTPVTISGTDGTLVYGVNGGTTKFNDNAGKSLAISGTSGTFDVSTIAAGVKNITAANGKNNPINIVGNSQNNAITIGAGGGTLYGGYKKTIKNNALTTAATTDQLVGTKTGDPVTFVIDSLSGNDQIINYKDGDTISIAAGTGTLDFSSASVIKDGGYNKDVSITYSGKNKITIKQNTADKITFNVNGTTEYYGVDLPEGVSLDAKRTAISVGSSAQSTTLGIEGWNNGTSDNALKQMAPKLNTIDVTAANKNAEFVLEGQASVTSILKGGPGKTTMIGGTAADQFYGGTGSDVFVVDISSTTGKDVINSVGGGDLIMVKGVTSDNTIALSSKGVLTYYSDPKSTEYKNNSLTVKTIKNNNTSNPVVVIDEHSEILAVNSNSGVVTPKGLNATLKAGLTTDGTFDGTYNTGAYVKGGSVDLSTGKPDNPNEALSLSGTAATIDAADYGGAVKGIVATLVGSGLEYLSLTGNASVKNTIYVPVAVTAGKKKDEPISVSVKGGTQADTFYGNSSTTLTTVYYDMYAGGKDVINNYDEEGDVIRLNGVTLTGASDTRISEKSSDVAFQFDNKNSLTIKNGATKNITFIDDTGKEVEYGHVLPKGLEYDNKHTAINASSNFNSSDNDFVTFNKNGTVSEITSSLIEIDLSNTTPVEEEAYYYAGVKTVSLSGVGALTKGNNTLTARVSGNTVANELYAPQGGGTLYGGDPGAKADADKLYGNKGAEART